MAVYGLNSLRAAAAAAVMLAGTGCGGPPVSAPPGSGCMPPPFSLSANSVRPGGKLTVKAGDAHCNPRYGGDAKVLLEITDGSGEKVVETLAPMNDAGGFSATISLPDAAVSGQGAVTAYPWNLDWCDDTGRNNRVGSRGSGADGAADMARVSCVLPSRPLTIEP